jgi:hypothetical protein
MPSGDSDGEGLDFVAANVLSHTAMTKRKA